MSVAIALICAVVSIVALVLHHRRSSSYEVLEAKAFRKGMLLAANIAEASQECWQVRCAVSAIRKASKATTVLSESEID